MLDILYPDLSYFRRPLSFPTPLSLSLSLSHSNGAVSVKEFSYYDLKWLLVKTERKIHASHIIRDRVK